MYNSVLTLFLNIVLKHIYTVNWQVLRDNSNFEEQLTTMLNIATGLFVFSLILLGVFLLLFPIYSYFEKEHKAVEKGVFVLVLYIILLVGISFLPEIVYPYLLLFPVLALAVVLPKFGNNEVKFENPSKRFDERDVIFSRNSLKTGTEQFDNYYKMRPENKPTDDAFRAEPGLMDAKASMYNEVFFSAARASFEMVDLLQPLVEQVTTRQTKSTVSKEYLAEFLTNWTVKLGALDVGFTTIKPHHIYTHIGRGEAYGNEVDLDHKYTIAFTVEMNYEAMSYNPKGPVVMESSQQYLNAGQIAVQVAQLLRHLGHQARAHIDANYRLICPIVAQDAGLGVIGRMGLLMTPKYGSRVRIGLVSTNLELPNNKRPIDSSVLHFCEICKKCASNCPSQAIPTNSVTKQKSPKRWTINQESCFTFWSKIGTDCGRCVAVCPYSHPDNFMHNIVRWMIKRNPINRWLALKLDDLIYGRKPSSNKQKPYLTKLNI